VKSDPAEPQLGRYFAPHRRIDRHSNQDLILVTLAGEKMVMDYDWT